MSQEKPPPQGGGKVFQPPQQLPSLESDFSLKTTANSRVSSLMPPSEIIAILTAHGCENITDHLNLSSCSSFPLSSGGFGDVYRGRLRDDRQVAIKTMRVQAISSEEGQKPLKDAARELHTWSKCQHPNVLKLLGVVHFRNGNAVLTDFGNAVLQERSLQFTTTVTKSIMSPRWAAPELIEGTSTRSMAADVYALGMTVLETITGRVPYAEKDEHAVYFVVAVKKELPTRPEDHIPSDSLHGSILWDLLKTCWAYDPKDRPSAEKVGNIMRTITSDGLISRSAKAIEYNNPGLSNIVHCPKPPLLASRMPPEAKTSVASIVTAEHAPVTSKYTLVTLWVNPETNIPLAATFNINTDILVPAFTSTDAPTRKTLSLEWTTEDQFCGFDQFSGEIGGDRIYIMTRKGIKVKGTIVGGPTSAQSFVGTGTWARA
ncbi:hypothetical protein FRC06_001249 [Ceratobasidium sp. 370]|nr:hypothetical protein FRC06_001249 [Ceratobasidium sp. 370]